MERKESGGDRQGEEQRMPIISHLPLKACCACGRAFHRVTLTAQFFTALYKAGTEHGEPRQSETTKNERKERTAKTRLLVITGSRRSALTAHGSGHRRLPVAASLFKRQKLKKRQEQMTVPRRCSLAVANDLQSPL